MININLIAERRNKRIREAATIRWAILGGISLAGLVIFLVFITFVERGWEQGQCRKLSDEITRKKADYTDVQQIEAEIRRMEPRVVMLKQVRASEGAWMTILADLSTVIPSDVFLETVTANAKEKEIALRLTGVARDQQAVAHFLTVLRTETKWALTPQLGPVAADKSSTTLPGGAERPEMKRVRFEISVPIRGMMGGNL
jgi:Tfp pilus assembly protein PilN